MPHIHLWPAVPLTFGSSVSSTIYYPCRISQWQGFFLRLSRVVSQKIRSMSAEHTLPYNHTLGGLGLQLFQVSRYILFNKKALIITNCSILHATTAN